MTMKPRVLSIFLLAFLLAGCVGSTSVTVTKEAIPTQKSTVAITPTPTFPPATPEPRTKALSLLKNNGNCRLPCIWGLTPGITTTGERQKVLASYNEFLEPDISFGKSEGGKNPGGMGVEVIKDDISITLGLTYYETDNLIEILSLVTRPQRDQKSVFGDSTYSNLTEYYSLPQLLSNYGLPSDVLVISFPHDPFVKADYDPFSIVVIYEELGIMAEYISPTQRVGDQSRGCPGQSYLTLRTWDTKKNIPLKKIASIAAGDGISETAYDYFLPVQDATSMSISDFYNTFKEPDTNQCLEVPSNLWTI